MKTEIWDSDPFTAQKNNHLLTLDTEYRFERNDELFLHAGGKRIKARIIHIRWEIDGDGMRRELLVLKL